MLQGELAELILERALYNGILSGIGLDAPQGEIDCKDGYYYINREWNQEETIVLDFPMEVRRIKANPLVRENIGKVSLMRGPMVYCMEEGEMQVWIRESV